MTSGGSHRYWRSYSHSSTPMVGSPQTQLVGSPSASGSQCMLLWPQSSKTPAQAHENPLVPSSVVRLQSWSPPPKPPVVAPPPPEALPPAAGLPPAPPPAIDTPPEPCAAPVLPSSSTAFPPQPPARQLTGSTKA